MAESQTPSLEALRVPFTFAVVGDTHFSRPSPQTRLALGPSHESGQEDFYADNVGYALTPAMATLRAVDPAFVVLTGDLCSRPVEGAVSDGAVRDVVRFLRGYGLPLIFARGEDDPEAIHRRRIARAMRVTAGIEPEETYFCADIGPARIVVLDTPGWTARQGEWLREVLAAGEKGPTDRLFLFGHHPIWPVARAFSSDLTFCRDLRALLDRYAIDAYFCGHTHDQTMILRETRSRPVLQCSSAPLGLPEEAPTPLDRVQAFLSGPDETLLQWSGYLENTAPGWFQVQVRDAGVEVEWHHLNRGVEARARWNRRGDIQSFWQMEHPPDARLIRDDLPTIRRAFLRYNAWDARRPGKWVRINGVDVGNLPAGNSFAPRRLELPPAVIPRLESLNRVEITAPGVEAATIGNLQIEAHLPAGRIARTKPTGEIFTWSDRWTAWQTPGLVKVMAGRPIRTVLSFG